MTRAGAGSRQHGFTLLEAIVALAIMAGVGAALFSWINTSLIALQRIEDANRRQEAMVNALQYLDSVNPMLRPVGDADLGGYRIRWKAQIVEPERDGVDYPVGLSLYRLALYRTRVEVVNAEGGAWFDFSLDQVGHRQARKLQLPFR
jgi:general secretion pathway protein I